MPQVFAHRGLHREVRENTLDAFRAAVALGVDGVELDVRRTADGALVVHHDPVVDGLVISQSRWRELPTYIPTLDESMWALGGVRVNVEIKNYRDDSEPTYDESGSFATQVVTFLHEAGWDESVIISCFDLETCVVVRSLDSMMPIGWLLWAVDPHLALTQAHVLGLNAINPHFSVVDEGVIGQATSLGLDVNVWTVNKASDIEKMKTLGVSSIISDDPGLVREILTHVR